MKEWLIKVIQKIDKVAHYKELTAVSIVLICAVELSQGYFRGIGAWLRNFRFSRYRFPFLLSVLLILVLMLFDQPLWAVLHEWNSPVKEAISLFGRHFGRNLWIWVIALYFAAWATGNRESRKIIFGAMAASALSGIFITGLKFIFLRARPTTNVGAYSFFNLDGLLKDDSAYQSFSSGDVAIVSAAAFFMAATVRNKFLKVFFILIPFATAFARVSYDRHWPSDTLASMLISGLMVKILLDFKKSQGGGKEKACSQCGKKFSCTADEQCWCSGVELTGQERASLREKNQDCLCPACLQAAHQVKE